MHFPDKTKPWVCTDRSSDKGLLELDPVNWCTPYSDWASTKMISLRRAYTEGGTHRRGQCWRVELWQKIVRFKSGHCLWCFFTGCLDFSSSFFALHLSTFRLWIYWSLQPFCGAMWDFTLHRTERERPKLSFHEHFFLRRCQHKQLLISPSPIPAVTHPSAVPFQSCMWNKSQTTSRLKIAEKDREGEKWFPEPGLTSYRYIQGQHDRTF